MQPKLANVTKSTWLTAKQREAWRSLNVMFMQLNAELERRLLQHSNLSYSDYLVLVVLTEQPEDRMRLFELGDALGWEKSRLSHHLTRMEARGLVKKVKCDSDRRGLFVEVTKKGLAEITEVAPHHVQDVRELFISHVTADEIETISKFSDRVLQNFDAQ